MAPFKANIIIKMYVSMNQPIVALYSYMKKQV